MFGQKRGQTDGQFFQFLTSFTYKNHIFGQSFRKRFCPTEIKSVSDFRLGQFFVRAKYFPNNCGAGRQKVVNNVPCVHLSCGTKGGKKNS